jgi:hypothetical protein
MFTTEAGCGSLIERKGLEAEKQTKKEEEGSVVCVFLG